MRRKPATGLKRKPRRQRLLRFGPKREREANSRQIDPLTKRNGARLLEEFAYLGDNHWLRRDGPTWATAARELDGAVTAAIADCGYLEVQPSPTNWMLVWEADPILQHATVRSTLTERGFVLQYMKEHLHVHAIWQAAHWKMGVFSRNGLRILNRAYFPLIQPVGKGMPRCWDVYTTGLFTCMAAPQGPWDETAPVPVAVSDQRERALGLWRETLRHAHAGGLNRGYFQPAGLVLVSEHGGAGKGLYFRLNALSLGDTEAAAAGGYLAGDRLGCSHLLQRPVVELSDASVADRDVSQAQTLLLNLVSNPTKAVRMMRTEEWQIPLSPMLCVSLNSDNPACTRVFRGLPMSVKEKWIAIRCGSGTAALRDAGFDYADLERTLPEMVGYLLNSATPDEYLHEEIDGRRQPARFLVGHYFDPVLDLEWGPLGDLAPVWEDIQAVVAADFNPPKSGRYKVSQLRTLLLTIRDLNGDPTYRDMTVKAFSVVLQKIQTAIPSVLQRTAVGNPKNGGWYEYWIV